MLTIPDPNNEGATIEVYTAEELAAKEAEFTTVRIVLEEKLTDAEKRATERAGEFAQFRKLSDEQVSKLTVAERTIYENQVAMAAKDELLAAADKKTYDSTVDATIRAKVGNDPKVFEKVKAMYSLIGLEDVTPEQMQARVSAAAGAVMQTEPDLLAMVSVTPGGSFEPPKPKAQGEQSFADTEKGKSFAKALGLTTEPPKEQ